MSKLDVPASSGGATRLYPVCSLMRLRLGRSAGG
jgi:hypothetical protein